MISSTKFLKEEMKSNSSNTSLLSGGPVVVYEDNVVDNKFGRFILVGTVHGAFTDCGNEIPGIFVEVDDMSVLEFLYKETFGSGLFFENVFFTFTGHE